MADLRAVLGGSFVPPPTLADLSPEQQLAECMERDGLVPPKHIVLDGRIHRFASRPDKPRNKDGWYVGYLDGRPAGVYGSHALGIESRWRAEGGVQMSPAEEIAHNKRMSEMLAMRDAERAEQHRVVSDLAATIWDEARDADASHPYLVRKGVQPHGAKVTGDGRLVVPLYGIEGEISSLQYIDEAGGKHYQGGGETAGKFWMVGAPAADGVLYIAEGFATAATVHEVSGRSCVVAYSASNLVPVTEIMRRAYPGADIVIVADNDKGGIGEKYASQACAKHGVRFVMPPLLGDANDYLLAGHDLAGLLTPSAVVDWLIPADDFASQPAPISWLVKGWLQAEALAMFHGPSGGGKTFVVLDMCCRIAAGGGEWQGHKVKAGSVVYLAGEGHHGLRGRVAAWKLHNEVGSLSMWLSRDGCDLNTAEGLRRVMDNVHRLQTRPSVIVVDTLHRFLSGDENSAQDAKTMLDACAKLMQEFSCAVLLVHHTGVSEEAQARARGSSAWRGALDIEVSIVPSKGDGPISIVQRKSKDAEMSAPQFARLQSVAIPGWVDEDGGQVTSAVLVASEAPEAAPPKETKGEKHRKLLENAWWHSGNEVREGAPYVSRAGFLRFLVESQGLSESSAAVYLKPGSPPGRPVRDLLDSQIIATHEHGWVVCDSGHASAMLLMMSREQTEQRN